MDACRGRAADRGQWGRGSSLELFDPARAAYAVGENVEATGARVQSVLPGC